MARTSKSINVPKPMQATFDEVVALTDPVCLSLLNEEYAELARQAAAALCRKRPSPLATGRLNTWACGIVYALGQVNFAFDKSAKPYVSGDELCEAFGLSKVTASAKAKVVRDILKMRQLDHTWCLPSRLKDNPIVWMISVNGFIIDARDAPIEVQELAFEKGLIPYIPDELEAPG